MAINFCLKVTVADYKMSGHRLCSVKAYLVVRQCLTVTEVSANSNWNNPKTLPNS